MSETITYYGRIDYPTLLLRQLDRIAEIRTRITLPVQRPDVFAYYNAVKTLYMLAPPVVRREVGPPPRGLEELDGYLERLRDALETHGLIGGRPLEVGRPEVKPVADVFEEGD